VKEDASQAEDTTGKAWNDHCFVSRRAHAGSDRSPEEWVVTNLLFTISSRKKGSVVV
jgi:hypothetical protein